MSRHTSTATIVGVSYIDKMDELLDDEERMDDEAGELGLQAWCNMRRFDAPDDLYIGVVFYDRPTDAEVEEAKQQVAAGLPKLVELFGEPSSGIEIWNGVMVS